MSNENVVMEEEEALRRAARGLNPIEALAIIETKMRAARALSARLSNALRIEAALEAQGVDPSRVRALGRRGGRGLPQGLSSEEITAYGLINLAYMKDGSTVDLVLPFRRVAGDWAKTYRPRG